MLFIQNTGQWPDDARFQVWGSPAGVGTTWLADDAIWITIVDAPLPSPLSFEERGEGPGERGEVRGLNLKLTFPGSSPHVQIQPLNPLTTTVSYFHGNDPAQWRPAVPVYGAVRYVDLYPGVDLVLDGQDTFWRLEAAPGAETASVRLQVEGAETLAIDGATLRLAAQDEPFEIALPQAPFAYQANGVSPQGEALDLNVRPFVDPPRLPAVPDDDTADQVYSTFLGGGSEDVISAIAVDTTDQATVVGCDSIYQLSNHTRRLRPHLQRGLEWARRVHRPLQRGRQVFGLCELPGRQRR